MILPRAELPAFLKALLPSSPLPLPRSIMLFTFASLSGSTLLFIISMLDFGYLSMRINPCVAVYTIVYHIAVLLISRRPRTPGAPSYFSTTVFSGYLLAVVWLVAFILTIVVLASGHMPYYQVAWLRQQGLSANIHSQRLQIFLTLYQTLIVGGMSVKGHAIVHHEGPDPHDWRYMEAEDKTPHVV